MKPNPLAHAILLAAKAHEDSYDHEAAAAATKAADKARSEDPDNLYAGLVDYSQFYRETLQHVCLTTIPAALATPVYLLLDSNWNDAIDWAKEHV